MTELRPFTLIAELTHRCPLSCPHCSNPLELVREEMPTDAWRATIDAAEALGVMQVHFTGGEPLVRPDVEELVAFARERGLYTNLVTSAVPLPRARVRALRDAGLDHAQLSLHDVEDASADPISGLPGAHARKLEAARAIVEEGISLTINFVLQRDNIDRVEAMIALARDLGADRVELANAQWLGWAAANVDELLPSEEQVARAREVATAARDRGGLEVSFVLADRVTGRARACMEGWARKFLHVSPDGVAMPCHAARTIPTLPRERVTDRPLAEIWREGGAFVAFRGEAWMQEPCASCDRRSIDFGGCRCQAYAAFGDARRTDPACALSPHRATPSRSYGARPRVFLHRGRVAS